MDYLLRPLWNLLISLKNLLFPTIYAIEATPNLNFSHLVSLDSTPAAKQAVDNEKEPTFFIMPDLVGDCPFPLGRHPNADELTAESTKWLVDGCPELSSKRKEALWGLQAGLLTARCYPYCPPERMRIVADFLGYLFHLDNISDGMLTKETDVLADAVMNAHWLTDKYKPTKGQPEEEISAGKLARDYWSRCMKNCKPGPAHRFKETLEQFFESVNLQAQDRDANQIPDLESFIDIRRDTSGCKSTFDLIEYAYDIDVPQEVLEHPVIEALKQGSNDLVAWSNDIFSYNVEQARGDDTHNLIPIFMKHHGMNLQEAVDMVGKLCKDTIDAFVSNIERIPDFGDERVNREVKLYVQGLQDWIVGSLHWSFETERYFGKDGQKVKDTRIVHLLPKRVEED